MKKTALFVFLILMLSMFSFSVNAAYDMFLQVGGIEGESQESAHKNWIEVNSYSHKITNTVTGASTSTPSTHSEFTIVKELDKSSPLLSQYSCSGTAIPQVTLELVDATHTRPVFMRYKLSNVVVSSIAPTGQAGQDMPLEEVSFKYGIIEWEYMPRTTTGAATSTIKRGWNVLTNSAI